MNTDDPLQKNIRHTAGIRALKQIRAIVDEDNANEAFKARALRWLLRYGWLVLLLVGLLLAYLFGVI
jgi:hypothetical protein